MGQSGPRRVTIFRGADELWRYRVQGWNWRTLEASQIGTHRRSTLERLIARRFPNVEVVVQE